MEQWIEVDVKKHEENKEDDEDKPDEPDEPKGTGGYFLIRVVNSSEALKWDCLEKAHLFRLSDGSVVAEAQTNDTGFTFNRCATW